MDCAGKLNASMISADLWENTIQNKLRVNNVNVVVVVVLFPTCTYKYIVTTTYTIHVKNMEKYSYNVERVDNVKQ